MPQRGQQQCQNGPLLLLYAIILKIYSNINKSLQKMLAFISDL